jgi:hypothetical protein
MLQEGMYGLELKTQIGGYGVGSLVLKGGKIYGVDSGGVSYDGVYKHENGVVDATIHVQFPPNTQSVTGITRPNSWGFDVNVQFPASAGGFIGSVRTPDGPVQAKLTFMRPIPN